MQALFASIAGVSVGAVSVTDVAFGPDFPQPPQILARDVARTVRLGERVMWTFGDTLTNIPNGTPSASTAWSTTAAPLAIEENMDERGIPLQTIPLEPAEEAAHQRLYPVGTLANRDGTASVFYEIVSIHPPFVYDHLAPLYTGFEFHRVGVGTFAIDSATGVRSPAFIDPLPSDWLVTGAVGRSASTYLFFQRVSDAEPDHPIFVARLRRDVRAPWIRFWTGNGWSPDLTAAAPVARLPSLWGVSVSYNRYLRRYLFVYGAHDWTVRLRTASSPVRGWSNDVIVTTLPPGAYAAFHQPDLVADPSRLFITYYQSIAIYLGKIGTFTAQLHR